MMSILCGYCRYREIARFADANQKEFQHFFNLRKRVMPSHVTFRDILQRVNFEQLNDAFTMWARQSVSIEPGDWISVDGKAIRSTVSNYDKSYQNFVSLVSFFSQKQGQVVQVARLENGKSSEIPAVQKMIELFDLKDVIFTMDALHCQKKRLNSSLKQVTIIS
jgi:FMN phosphatase YigB (HAD superfamily)